MAVVDDDPRGVAEHKDGPDEDVAGSGAASLGEPAGELAQQGLAEEGEEGRVSEDPDRGGDDVLVARGGEEEDHHHGL